MKKKIYVCAPFGTNNQTEQANARTYYGYVLEKDCVPVGPHAYAEMFGSEEEDKKKQMHRAGMSLLWFCDEVWLFGEAETEWMKEELNFCRNMKIPVKKIKIKKLEERKQ